MAGVQTLSPKPHLDSARWLGQTVLGLHTRHHVKKDTGKLWLLGFWRLVPQGWGA